MIYYFQNKPLDPVLLEVYTVHVQSSFVLILQYIFFIIPHICISNMQTNHFLTLFFGTRYDKNGVLGRKGKEKT